MNFKKTALVLAMAGIVSVPMVVQADSGFYGSIRQGLQSTGNDAAGSDDNQAIANRGSRMGFKGETDLGNGMTGFGHYEFGVNTSGTAETVTRRKAYVGIKGDFGSIKMGQDYHTYYNHINGPVDIANWNSGFYSQGRTNQALTYAGGSGAITFGATIYARSDDDPTVAGGGDTGIDSTEIAATYDAGMFTVGLGMISSSNKVGADGEDRTGITISGNAGPVYLALSMQSQDLDSDYTEISASMGQAYLAYGVQDKEGNLDGDAPSQLTLGYTIPVGTDTVVWLEYYKVDSDMLVANSGDTDSIEAILKYSWN